MDINFRQISPYSGDKRGAFEELCCQLARRTLSESVLFTRLDGSGGDGGVECFADFPNGTRTGWQAKYVFNIKSLLTQAEKSLNTALEIHPALTRYVVCFPFNLTGKTKRRGLSGVEKLDNWCQQKISATKDRKLAIEFWPASKLLDLLFRHDASGGMREFFFNEKVLTNEWFSKHLELAKVTAGVRYTPELNVRTDLWKWFAAFGRTSAWSREFKEKIFECRKAHSRFVRALSKSKPDPSLPAWPEDLCTGSQELANDIERLCDEYDRTVETDNPESYKSCISQLDDIWSRLKSLESELVDRLQEKHGKGSADSPGFRQFMSEYMVSFPAANLDCTRDLIAVLEDLNDWFRSPACLLAYEKIFLLKGIAGSGKTHGVCDAADIRLKENFLTCVVFGHKFGGDSDLWTRLLETLGLPMTLGRDCFLDVLNAAGEASGTPLLLCIDAINETRPLRYWHDQLQAFIQEVRRRPHLRLCLTCRTSFIPFCLPDGHGLPVIEHVGFAGMEHVACQAFFEYYELDPPVTPILQPEFSNPLYLRLVCETLRSRGLRALPTGWQGLAPTVHAFLEEKEKQFALDKETSRGSKTVSACLIAISQAIADSGKSALPWPEAQKIISNIRPQALNLRVLEWLVQNDLLLEDAPDSFEFPEEFSLRPAFERLGDFFVAEKVLERCGDKNIYDECEPGGALYDLLKDAGAIERNREVLAALSIIIPEKNPGLEIHGLTDDRLIRKSLLRIAIEAFPFRNPETFSDASGFLLREAMGLKEISFAAMDAVVALSWQPSSVDAIWLDQLLKETPLALRDAYWCAYLYDRFEKHGTVYRLIEAAFELPLGRLDLGVAERWALTLFWFTAAADRRVKDKATRAATAILAAKPEVMSTVLKRLLESDDDEVRERILLVCYGVLIVSRDIVQCNSLAFMLHSKFTNDPEAFNNALVRDHIRCIAELVKKLDSASSTIDLESTMRKVGSSCQLVIPPDDKVEKWGKSFKFQPSKSDFFNYSMGCLRPWEHAVSRSDMAKWMLEQIAVVLGYEGSGCEIYDQSMIGKYGGGRAKPAWAERIVKKYQWISMYQLASRLHNQFERERKSCQSESLREPLILLKGRKLDPTLQHEITKNKDSVKSWWIRSAADLDLSGALSDEEWVTSSDGIPELEDLLSVINHDEKKWRLLVSHLSWDSRDKNADLDTPYRRVWMSIQSYLVPRQKLAKTYECLQKRNFFGRWMPEGDKFLYGFAGEYPWATPFNMCPDEHEGSISDLAGVLFNPCWNELLMEWEYDASILRNFAIIVPARAFFSLGDLWWNGEDGYNIVGGTTVFRDPSVTEAGPTSLLADAGELKERLRKLGFRLVWTLLGEKIDESENNFQRRTFSQSAYLNAKGSLKTGERVFFDDYDQDTGLGNS